MADGATVQIDAPAVALNGVDVTFRLAGGGPYRAVVNATLDVAHGEFVAIVGPYRLRQINAAQYRRRSGGAVGGPR